ncbi:hypothetical protein PILCRDRAFT_15889 [Piloderma croceum F 1598]|uniref:Uncharacterized protein n=1 Tax=Piloderma croceum (strain F 1598) TaxID=765440 RepID=A0A0C3EXK2_PILCF|nr:hypothetical protein PILCRDRAFT_15889 [Piloderma croceum F 1598]
MGKRISFLLSIPRPPPATTAFRLPSPLVKIYYLDAGVNHKRLGYVYRHHKKWRLQHTLEHPPSSFLLAWSQPTMTFVLPSHLTSPTCLRASLPPPPTLITNNSRISRS